MGQGIGLVGVDEDEEGNCNDDRRDVHDEVDGGDARQQLHAQPPKCELERAAQARHGRWGGAIRRRMSRRHFAAAAPA